MQRFKCSCSIGVLDDEILVTRRKSDTACETDCPPIQQHVPQLRDFGNTGERQSRDEGPALDKCEKRDWK